VTATNRHLASRGATLLAIAALGAVGACGGATTAGGGGSASDASAPTGDPSEAGTTCTLLEEVKLSPRSDAEAEQLAFEAAGTLTAPTNVYTRIHADLASLRAQFPEVASIHARRSWDNDDLELVPDAIAVEALKHDAFRDWDCANARYGGTTISLDAPNSPSGPLYFVRLSGRRFNMPLLEGVYAALPHVKQVVSGGTVGDSSDVCASFAGNTYSYAFKLGAGDCPAGCTEVTFWGFSTQPDGTVKSLGQSGPGPNAKPDWLQAVPDCVKWI
jgi:hypothetical protein